MATIKLVRNVALSDFKGNAIHIRVKAALRPNRRNRTMTDKQIDYGSILVIALLVAVILFGMFCYGG